MIKRVLNGARRRFLRPWVNEMQRVLTSELNIEREYWVNHFGDFRFKAGNRVEVQRTVDYGYEPMALGALLFLIRPEDIVWDIGASVGLYSVHLGARAAKVVAFEPDPATYARLKENVNLNRLEAKIDCHQLALGEKSGELELATDGLNGYAPVLAMGRLGRHEQRVKITVRTIDELAGEGFRAPSVIKIDIEGAELLALKGSENLLGSGQRPRVLFIEVHPKFLPNFGGTEEEVRELLRRKNYQVISTREREDQYHVIAVMKA